MFEKRRRVFAEYCRAQRGRGQTVQEHAQTTPTLTSLATVVDEAAYSSKPLDEGDIKRAPDWRE